MAGYRLTIEIDTDTAAFRDVHGARDSACREAEIRRILNKYAYDFTRLDTEWMDGQWDTLNLLDNNGHIVGQARVSS